MTVYNKVLVTFSSLLIIAMAILYIIEKEELLSLILISLSQIGVISLVIMDARKRKKT